ncbi:MAG: 4-hydroxyphenylacetate 3-hydroxylase N-terminal domain-containing protein [Dethiobacteria bacterium]
MGIATPEQYLERMFRMRKNIYMGGEVIGRDDPRLKPGPDLIVDTFERVDDPDLKGLITATSHITGEEIHRLNHIHQSSEDLLKKQELTRLLCQKVGGCIQRCMGIDALNAISVVTKDMDDNYGTEYYQRFLEFMKYFQKNDLVGNCAQSDVKGDRSKRPFEQTDPDLYLRVIEKRKDGIVVRGCKAHNSNAPFSDEIIVLPTRLMTEQDAPWSVAFAIPADAPGIKQVVRISAPRERKYLKTPYHFGLADSMTIFDDVFVPWERVFLCGETYYASLLAMLFATYHRHSYTGCKPAITDLILGITALAAEYNGVEGASHIKDKLSELIATGELVYAAGIAASVKSTQAASGTHIPNIIYTNVGRYHAGVKLFHEFEIMADVAGGLPATLPYEEEFFNPEIKDLLEKYIMRKDGISAEKQHRLFRALSDMLCSAHAGVALVGGLHGGGSPIMEKIAIRNQYDIDYRKRLVKRLCGIDS